MKIKKFRAKTFAEALEMVKRQLGRDAVILATDESKGLRRYVEITAAVDPDPSATYHSRTYSQWRQGEESERVDEEIVTLKNELRNLRQWIEEMRNTGYELSLPPTKRRIFQYLKDLAVSDEFAIRLAERARSIKELPSLISKDIAVSDRDYSGKAVMLIGPTGVGKTTTVAKLAARQLRAGKRVGLVTLDTYRIGAIEQIRIYARVMGVSLNVVSDVEELKRTLEELSFSRDVVFIDTIGRRSFDNEYITHLKSLIESVSEDSSSNFTPALEVHLLVAANTDERATVEATRYYGRLPIHCIGVTKVDEAVRFGNIYNVGLLYQRPFAYITTGQKVPEDIEFIDRQTLVRLILSRGCLYRNAEV